MAFFNSGWLTLTLLIAHAASLTPASAATAAAGTDRVRSTVSILVTLEGEPTADLVLGGNPGAALASLRNRTQNHAAELQSRQAALQSRLQSLGARVTGRFTRVVNAIRVRVAEDRLDEIRQLPGVRRVERTPLYHQHLSSSVRFVGAHRAWSMNAGIPGTNGLTGRGIRIGIIDSGIDYTHADFGGSGSSSSFDSNDSTRIEPGTFPTAKVAGGFDFAGDDYNPGEEAHETPRPDPDPLDCKENGHGTHVAGIAAGLGVLLDGNTYRGDYGSDLDFGRFRIAPGTAPEASLYALKVFGCAGATDLVTDALEWAADPNGDHDFSDRLDVVNLSLGGQFGTLDPEAADLQAANRLAQLGCVVVCSAGNNDNIYFAASSPGVAERAISVANVIDEGKGQALEVLAPSPAAGKYYLIEGAITVPLTNSGPVLGTLVAYSPALACVAPSNAAELNGKIVLIDRGTCFFSEKINRAQDAGAMAVVMVNNQETAPIEMGGESEGIRIPGGMISKADGAVLKARLAAGETLSIRLDAKTTIDRVEFVDTLSDSSSRGPASPSGLLKPDIGAPGVDILSAKAGSGGEGTTLTGTSMSAPAVSGAAALLLEAHPTWGGGWIKAVLMNSAQPIADEKGVAYPESRMGAGRLRVDEALKIEVTAAVAGKFFDSSLSFGSLVLGGIQRTSQTLLLSNHSTNPALFRIAISNSVSQRGITLTPRQNTVSVPGHGSTLVTLDLVADPSAFALLPDDTTAPNIGAGTLLPRHFLFEASGQVWFLADRGSIHVPFHASARAAADFKPVESRILLGAAPGSASTMAKPELTIRFGGQSVNTNTLALVSAFQLGETSSNKQLTDANRAAADLLAVGAATDFAGAGSLANSMLYFGIATAGDWTSPQPPIALFEVLIDQNRDGDEDYVIYNANASATNSAGGQDVFFSILLELNQGFRVLSTNAVSYLNVFPADELDTALFNNSTLVLSAPADLLGLAAGNSSFRYKVLTYSPSGSVDGTSWIPFDAARPVIDTTAFSDDGTPFYVDGEPLPVRLDREAAFLAGHRLPAVLLLHHFGLPGKRMNLVTLDLGQDDTDYDGLPDWWEQRHFAGLTTANNTTDTDADGAPDRHELGAGTDPNNARTSLKMLSATRASRNNISVRWSGNSGQRYVLERSSNLADGFTETIRDDIQATPPINSITDTNAPGDGPYFYRVKLKP